MTHPSSPPAPMTAGKLKSLRETTEGNIRSRALRGLAPGSYATDIALLDHIDALTARVATLEAELAAARKIEDKEVSEFIDWLRLEQNEPGISAGLAWRYERTQQLLSALSAALKEAERELQSLQETTGGILTRAALIARADAAEARAQSAEAQLKDVRKHSREAYDHLCSNAIESVRRSRAMELLRLVIALQWASDITKRVVALETAPSCQPQGDAKP